MKNLSPTECVQILEMMGLRPSLIAKAVDRPYYVITRTGQGGDPGYEVTDALRALVKKRYLEVRGLYAELEARYGKEAENAR